jgi:hypothetical protein
VKVNKTKSFPVDFRHFSVSNRPSRVCFLHIKIEVSHQNRKEKMNISIEKRTILYVKIIAKSGPRLNRFTQ